MFQSCMYCVLFLLYFLRHCKAIYCYKLVSPPCSSMTRRICKMPCPHAHPLAWIYDHIVKVIKLKSLTQRTTCQKRKQCNLYSHKQMQGGQKQRNDMHQIQCTLIQRTYKIVLQSRDCWPACGEVLGQNWDGMKLVHWKLSQSRIYMA